MELQCLFSDQPRQCPQQTPHTPLPPAFYQDILSSILSHSLKYCTTMHVKIYRILIKLENFKIGMDKPIILRLSLALMALARGAPDILITCQVQTYFPNLVTLDQHHTSNLHLLATSLVFCAIGLNVALVEWNKVRKKTTSSKSEKITINREFRYQRASQS